LPILPCGTTYREEAALYTLSFRIARESGLFRFEILKAIHLKISQTFYMSESTQKVVQRAVEVNLDQFENLFSKKRLAHGTVAS
jgi:hypothetical protein